MTLRSMGAADIRCDVCQVVRGNSIITVEALERL